MISSKLYIHNRNKKKIAVIVDTPKNAKGFAIIMHGLGGFKEQKLIAALSKTFFDRGFCTVRFDCRNTIGESEGSYEFASATSYYQDLEDVIEWAKKKSRYKEPFFLSGHSVGGMCVIKYAEKHPLKIAGIVTVASLTNGKTRLSNTPKKELSAWKKNGCLIRPSLSKPGVIFKLRYSSYVPDMIKWDTLKESDKLIMPIINIVGDKDIFAKKKDLELFDNKLKCKKEFHIIKGADHFFRIEKDINTLQNLTKRWIGKVERHG